MMYPVNFKTAFYFTVRSGEFNLTDLVSDLKSVNIYPDRISAGYSINLDFLHGSALNNLSDVLKSAISKGVFIPYTAPYNKDVYKELDFLLEFCSELIIHEV